MKTDNKYLWHALLIIITTAFLIISCIHKTDITGLPEVCFERDVLPVFKNNCAIPGCHDGGNRELGRALDNYNNIVNTVVPGNPDASSSYKAIVSKWGGNLMPPTHPISIENRTMIRLWIEQGAMQTVCTITKAPPDSLFSDQKNLILIDK
jgi:hypothetical protein